MTVSGQLADDDQEFTGVTLPFALEGDLPAGSSRISVTASGSYKSPGPLSCSIFIDGVLMQYNRQGSEQFCYASMFL